MAFERKVQQSSQHQVVMLQSRDGLVEGCLNNKAKYIYVR
ncbi:hypothetical protein HDF15_000465 [Granulicella mallensis]|uniref:Uncharacterized protein n=1 Tax=Granulicella mallensis TaxID=940614 RepID=A0A7W7ZLL1_9BACT|nr:hypothetical protein [Granulicella mallensis]